MAGKEGRSREARVMGLLKEMEENIDKEESQAYKLIHSLEDKLRNIVSNVDLRNPPDKKCDAGNVENEPSGGRSWTPESRDPRRPWTQVNRTKHISSIRELKKGKITSSEKQRGDGLNEETKDKSDTSLATTSSRVQQLKLFWDKFFLTEMEPVKSCELLDKNHFISEAKFEMLDKPRRKSMRKSAAKILEKTIPPSRVPISFRMVTSKQQSRPKKRIAKDDTYSDMNLIMSREVSTCVAKIRDSSDDNSDDDSDYTIADGKRSGSPCSLEKQPSVTDGFKENLYRIFLSHQLSSTTPKTPNICNPEDKKGIYRHGETGRQISCSQKRGIILTFKAEKPLKCYTEGVAIRQEEAIIIDPSILMKSKKPERKPRKLTTLLPCYYVTVQDNLPVDPSGVGDSIFVLDPKKHAPQGNRPNQKDPDDKESCRMRTVVSYEKITISTSSEIDKSHIKLVISKDDSMPRFSIFVIFTFSSVTILGFIVIAIKFFEGSFILY